MKLSGRQILLIFVGLAGLLVVKIWISVKKTATTRETVHEIVSSEELILELTPRLKKLNESVMNLRFPDHRSFDLFEDTIVVNDLDSADKLMTVQELSGVVGAKIQKWPVQGEDISVRVKERRLWQTLIEGVDYFEQAKFYIIRGNFDSADDRLFDCEMGFSGLARMQNGSWRGIRGKQQVSWRNVIDSNNENVNNNDRPWRIYRWHLKDLQITESPRLLFSEVLSRSVISEKDLEPLRNSISEEHLTNYVVNGTVRLPKEKYAPYFAITAGMQHPALSVVDIDQDGFDDLYVMVRWGRNMLLHNRGDGTFEDIAPKLGLDIEGVSAAGVFADFDNDGDVDLMLGRTLEPSLYLVNEGGHFVDASQDRVSVPLPYLVTSMSAADYNGDGLLDVYLCTYGFPADGSVNVESWTSKMLPPEQAREVVNRYTTKEVGYHRFINSIGPPNLLLVNRGGRFEEAPENASVQQYLNSFQATWADFDEDGDPDLYISNDFAADFLFRNDQSAGFTDITLEAGGAAMAGFGMGASWGDYDNDMRQDLYISNMYSKAGMRITAPLDNLDPRFRRSADGNRLFRYRGGGKFELVSGTESPGLAVVKAGWSWGGQFVDVDNDSFLDLYVTSGYRTAPEAISMPVDL